MSETRDLPVGRARQVALRAELRGALARREPVAQPLERCADALVEHLDIALATLWWVDASGAGADLVATSRSTECPPGLPQHVLLREPGIGALISALSPRVTADLAAAPELAPAELLAAERLTAFAGYPLAGSERPLGALAVYARAALGPETLEVLAWVADLIAVTLENRRLADEVRELLAAKDREAQARLVAQHHVALKHRVSQLLAAAISFDEAAPELVRELSRTLGWEVGALWHLEQPASSRQVTVWHLPDADLAGLADHLKSLASVPDPGVVSEVLRTGKPVLHAGDAPLPIAEDLPLKRIVRSAFGLPVIGEGVALGVFVFLDRGAHTVDAELRNTLVTIGELVGQFLRREQLEEQLIQSQKMEAVGKLAGGVAHDFNNILTVITGYAAMSLDAAPPDSALHEQSHEILSAAERATSLVNQLLAFSRKQVFQPRTLDLNIVVGDMERMLRRVIGEDVRLITRKPDRPSMVRVDLVHVEQVLVNLAVNSRDAMPQGGRLYIEIEHTDHEPPRENGSTEAPAPRGHPGPRRRFVRVVVRDTGSGMSEEARSHAFEPFYTTKSTGKGTGLGLATVYGIVRQNGGQIRVDSEPGQGAQFTILFPRLGEGAPSTAARDTRAASARGHETVLLVEDEKPVRRLARNILVAAGYDVIEAASAEEALQACARADRPIHLLLTDVVMPGMNGVELSRKLQDGCASTRVLYMSGYAEDSLFDGYAMDRDVAFLEKPFTPSGLATKVRQVLDAASDPVPPAPRAADHPAPPHRAR